MVDHAREENKKRPFTSDQIARIEHNTQKVIAQCEKEGRLRFKTRMAAKKRLERSRY
jgi:hypothetical protein